MSKSGNADISVQAVTGGFLPNLGVLGVFGDNADNSIEFSRNAAGDILVNGSAPSLGGSPTVANTNMIAAFGRGGNDVITLDETNGALPRASLFGGSGHDTIRGGSGNDLLFGEAGNDEITGGGGADSLFGGAGDDVLTGGDGDDFMFGGGGNDRMIWNPGDDSDVMEGGAGTDTAEVNGGNGAETFTAAANGARVQFDRVDPAPFGVDIGTTENLVVNMNGGDDVFSATGDLAALISVTVDGGAGNDTINGGNGADTLLGGEGDDFVDGNQGADVGLLGAGDDFFQWDPGDGSDVVEGQAGADTMLFNGSGADEIFDASANGARLRFARNLGNIVMDTDDVETLALNALGGADTITVNDLSGTDVAEVAIDLAGALDGTAGDGELDTVITNNTNGDDAIEVLGVEAGISVVGGPAPINVSHTDAADALVVNGLGGNDTINAAALVAEAVELTLDGGAGNDTINGGRGADVLRGGDGDDFVDGNQGNDVAFLGAGDDLFQWDPGDGSDVVEGEDGTDTMLFNGSGANESMDLAANGERLRFFRDVGSIVMDTNDLERVDVTARGGADTITVNDLTGTDVTEVAIDLAAVGGGGDAQTDSVIANATNGDDVAVVVGDSSGVSVIGLAAAITVTGAEGAHDTVTINGLDGADVIDASGVQAGAIRLVLDGGAGDDVIIGSDGDDVLIGGDGDDVLIGGLGDDVIEGGDGDDIEIQGFVAGAATEDSIDLSGRALSFEGLMAQTSDVDGSAVIDLGDQEITLQGVSKSALHQDDFLLS